MTFDSFAETQSAACFLNSFLREWPKQEIMETPSSLQHRTRARLSIRVFGLQNAAYLLPLSHESLTGRHRYETTFFRTSPTSSQAPVAEDFEELTLRELVRSLTNDLAQTLGLGEKAPEKFVARVLASAENIRFALSSRGARAFRNVSGFISSEQALLIGHLFHPSPKSRDEFSREDFALYSPEVGASFPLHWFLARPELLHIETARGFAQETEFNETFLAEYPGRADLAAWLTKGYRAFPVHPFQHPILMRKSHVRDAIACGDILDLGPASSSAKWYPTTSVRSLYNAHAPYMLKFSLSVRLTNSVRHLLHHEVVRGLQVSEALETETGQRFLSEVPQFSILREPAFMALKDEAGEPLADSIVVWRENPFIHEVAEKAAVLATLTQDLPEAQTRTLVQAHIEAASRRQGIDLHAISLHWFDRFMNAVLRPIFIAQAKYGILLGAHQQNVILRLEEHMPTGSWFRDCQGTGYSALGYERFSEGVGSIKRSNGNVLDPNQARTLFNYYLIVNTAFGVISAIASSDEGEDPSSCFATEVELLEGLRSFLLKLLDEGVLDRSCIEPLLTEPVIMQKGNFFCSIRDINENTTANPLAIYNPIPNPIHRASLARKKEFSV